MIFEEDVRRLLALRNDDVPVIWRLDWPLIERTLRHPFPTDYKRLCDHMPPGKFRDFLWLLHPIGSGGCSLLGEEPDMAEILDIISEEEQEYCAEQGEEPAFDRGQVFPCFRTDNGGLGLWIADSDDPDEWTIGYATDRSLELSFTDQSLSRFLCGFLDGGPMSGPVIEETTAFSSNL